MALKVIQVNLGRAKAAHDILEATLRQKDFDLAVVSEPNKKISDNPNWVTSVDKGVAIRVCPGSPSIEKVKAGNGYVRLRVGRTLICAIYVSPNVSVEVFRRTLTDALAGLERRESRKILLLGDFNAKSVTWGARATDKRGDTLEEWAAHYHLRCLNDGTPTFKRGFSVSHIDVTYGGEGLRSIAWKASFDNPFTHHAHIEITIDGERSRDKRRKVYTTDMGRFEKEIEKGARNGENAYEQMVRAAAKARTEHQQAEGDIYWWTEEIHLMKKDCFKKRRRAYKGIGRVSEAETIERERQAKEAKKLLKKAIRIKKKEKWKELLDELDQDPWGLGYKIVSKKLKKQQITKLSIREKVKHVKALFPAQKNEYSAQPDTDWSDEEYGIDKDELMAALERIKPRKAPGPDGIVTEVLKKAVEKSSEQFLQMFNKYMREAIFPIEWKIANVVLIPKPGRDSALSSSFRPICLLNITGKLFERIILGRLEREIEERKLISSRQHGFVKGRSTITAVRAVLAAVEASQEQWCALVLIDIKNAFNTASWQVITEVVTEGGISPYLQLLIRKYLQERRISVGGGFTHDCSAGVPQGSVLGPTLWNLLYNGILENEYTAGVAPVAYADDLAFVVGAKSAPELQGRVENTLKRVNKWLRSKKLEMAAEKTEICVLKGGRQRQSIDFIVDADKGNRITPKKTVKYLGIMISQNLNFGPHVKYVCEKTAKQTAALQKILPNVGGAGYSKRLVLSGAAHSTMLYAASIWLGAMDAKIHENALTSQQRKVLLRAVSAYRTVSATAAQVIAATPPIKLMAKERRFLQNVQANSALPGVRRQARKKTLTAWQKEWEKQEKWTRTLIGRIEPWVECEHRKTNYYFTQFLTGHGSFWSYTKRIGKTETDRCQECGIVDSPKHVLYECRRWRSEREELINKLEEDIPPVDRIIERMTQNKTTWDYIFDAVVEIMRRKEEEDRATNG